MSLYDDLIRARDLTRELAAPAAAFATEPLLHVTYSAGPWRDADFTLTTEGDPMTTPVQEALALSWAQLLDACSAVHAADKRKVHVEHVVIAGKTRAIVRPAKGNARFGLVVEAPEEFRDTDAFWAYDKDEHLERFQKLVEAGLVHREVRP